MLFGPAVEHATYVFLAPPLAWALLERRAWPLGQGLILASFALIMILGWGAVSRLLPAWPMLLTASPLAPHCSCCGCSAMSAAAERKVGDCRKLFAMHYPKALNE